MPATDANTIEELRQSLQELRSADLRKDEFLGNLGHELRNALTPLRIALQMLGMPGMDETRSRELRDATDRQLMRIVRMLDELMDTSQLARGTLTLQRETVDLASIVDNAVEVSNAAIKARKHTLEVHVPAQAIVVAADRNRLSQVIATLLGNAARYTEPGGRIELTLQRDADGIEILVQDNGRGIEADALPTLFQPFGARARHGQEGLGLGLARARGLTELHGGSLQARSAGTGKGSSFIVRLPLG